MKYWCVICDVEVIDADEGRACFVCKDFDGIEVVE
tara:strand:- start:3529 stop:3633 length:105 start_codon:yes stop_codon:yes gene_type:complete